jgi:hypothetical protein
VRRTSENWPSDQRDRARFQRANPPSLIGDARGNRSRDEDYRTYWKLISGERVPQVNPLEDFR